MPACGCQSRVSIDGFDDTIAQPFETSGHAGAGNIVVVDEKNDGRSFGDLARGGTFDGAMRGRSHVACS
jgi:hypothetical protein